VHPDEERFWLSQPDEFKERFEHNRNKFAENFGSLLAPMITSGTFGGNLIEVEGDEEVNLEANSDLSVAPVDKPKEFESEADLEKHDPIKDRTASEEADVEFLGGKSGATYVLVKKHARTIPKWTLLGG
jgi:hypothetical protein